MSPFRACPRSLPGFAERSRRSLNEASYSFVGGLTKPKIESDVVT